ncbi:hypothetical protein U1Q18_000904, partial [Sarracenia purpurea var. burkii]
KKLEAQGGFGFLIQSNSRFGTGTVKRWNQAQTPSEKKLLKDTISSDWRSRFFFLERSGTAWNGASASSSTSLGCQRMRS